MDKFSIYSSPDDKDYNKEVSFTATSGIDRGCDTLLENWDHDFFGRYFKIVIDSYHGLGAGWQYLNIEFTEGDFSSTQN